jgi:hypothetical protein
MDIKTKKTVITLNPEDLLRLSEVLVDGDSSEALRFLQEVLVSKVTCAQTESHTTAFEGETGKAGAHFTQKGEGKIHGEGDVQR